MSDHFTNEWEKYLLKEAHKIWNEVTNKIIDLSDKDRIFVLSTIVAKLSLTLALSQKSFWEENERKKN